MNCYDSPDSLGNPVLRDPAFRQAISWAVDKQKIVDFAYGGYATVGQSIITPDVPTYAWYAGARGDLRLRPREGQADARRGGLQGHERRRRARAQRASPSTLRLWARSDDVASQSTRQAGRRLVRRHRPQDRPPDARLGHDQRRSLQLQGRHVRARLRHLHLGLGRVRRPGLHPQRVHDEPDRGLERPCLVERGVRQALRAAGADHRPGAAQAAGRPDAADLLHRGARSS